MYKDPFTEPNPQAYPTLYRVLYAANKTHPIVSWNVLLACKATIYVIISSLRCLLSADDVFMCALAYISSTAACTGHTKIAIINHSSSYRLCRYSKPIASGERPINPCAVDNKQSDCLLT